MWTHYAGNYSGICIRYYAERLRDGLSSKLSFVRLGYDESPPRLSKSDVAEEDEAVRKIFAHKKYNWAYEREWRLLGPIGMVEIKRSDCIRTVYLGSRIRRDAQGQDFAGVKRGVRLMSTRWKSMEILARVEAYPERSTATG